MKKGDRFEHPSPLWKSLVVEFTGEMTGSSGRFVCIKAEPEPFITRSVHWEIGTIRFINLSALERLWNPINKSSNFKNLYEKLDE